MAPEVEFAGRSWEDPDSLAGAQGGFGAEPARCDVLRAGTERRREAGNNWRRPA